MRDGANARESIKDKNGDTVVDLVPADDPETLALIRKARAQASLAREDVVDGTHRWLRFSCTFLTVIYVQMTMTTKTAPALVQTKTNGILINRKNGRYSVD